MNPITPRFRLPDHWTGRGRCPVCRARGRLVVVHHLVIPDQMQCGACAAIFEVEAGGNHIRLLGLPPLLEPAKASFRGAWFLPVDLPALIAAALNPAPAAAEPADDSAASAAVSGAPESRVDGSLAASADLTAPAEAADPSGLIAQLEGVGRRPARDVDAVAQLLLGLIPDDSAPAASVTAPVSPDPRAPPSAAELSRTIHTLLYGQPTSRAQATPDASALASGDPPPSAQAIAPDPAPAYSLPPADASPQHPEPAPADLAARARQLHPLGNSPPLVRPTLDHSGAPPSQVNHALAGTQAQETQRQKRHRRTVALVGGGGALLVALILLSAWIASSARAAVVSGPTVAPGATISLFAVLFPLTATPEPIAVAAQATAVVPAADALPPDDGWSHWARGLVLDGLTVLNAPTPSISEGGLPPASCPETPAAAAGLFGGDGKDWSLNSEAEDWVLTVFGAPITVSIPANMSARYMVLSESLERRFALGPATLTNVNFAAVACGQ